VAVQNFGELLGAFFVCPLREPNKKMVVSLANVAAIHSSGSVDLGEVMKKFCQWPANAAHLTLSAFRSRTRQDRGLFRKNRGIFDESGIRMVGVRLQDVDFDSAALESIAVCLVLFDHFGKIRLAQRDGSQAGCKVGGGFAKNCVREHFFHYFLVQTVLSTISVRHNLNKVTVLPETLASVCCWS